jgi:hypothetical protein
MSSAPPIPALPGASLGIPSAEADHGKKTKAPPPGGPSLLAGCTYTGTGGCELPAGWTLVAQQDFECSGSHAVPPNPACGTLPSTQVTSVGGDNKPISSFEQTQAHSGSYAFGGAYTGDGGQVNWILGQPQSSNSGPGLLGSFSSVYISYWEYTDPSAQYPNSDYYLFHMVSPSLCNGLPQDVAYDAQPNGGGGAPPSSNAFMLPVANGNTTGEACQGYYQWANGGRSLDMMAGKWRQVEIAYTPSTSVTPPQANTPNVNCSAATKKGCGNGSLQLYINGQLSQQSLNANLNGTTSMANSDVEVGGVITDFCDAGAATRANPFTRCPKAAPRAFHRYFDDIIIMKK